MNETLTPIKAIRAKCLDCCCGQAKEVRLCPCEDCTLWPYRMGHRPKKDPATRAEIAGNAPEGNYTTQPLPAEKPPKKRHFFSKEGR